VEVIEEYCIECSQKYGTYVQVIPVLKTLDLNTSWGPVFNVFGSYC
jgi:hypothetical protein